MLTAVHPGDVRPRVFLLEPNTGLRRAIHDVLSAEEFHVQPCESLEQVLSGARGEQNVALVAWQSMEGLLADERRHHLLELTHRLRLVLMVPRRWRQLLNEAEFGLAGMIAKPFNADELVASVRQALDGTRATAQPAD
jgi:DNA-binding response OmpR family regulator